MGTSSGMGVAFLDCTGNVWDSGAGVPTSVFSSDSFSFANSFVSRSGRSLSFFSLFSFLLGLSLSAFSEGGPEGVEVPLVLIWLDEFSFGVSLPGIRGEVATRGDLTSFGMGEAGFSTGTGVDPLVGGFVVVFGNEDMVELGV